MRLRACKGSRERRWNICKTAIEEEEGGYDESLRYLVRDFFMMEVIAQSFRVESILSSQSTFEAICNASTDIALDFSVAHPSADVDVAQTRVQQTFSALPRETAVVPGQDYNCIILKKTLSRSHPAILQQRTSKTNDCTATKSQLFRTLWLVVRNKSLYNQVIVLFFQPESVISIRWLP